MDISELYLMMRWLDMPVQQSAVLICWFIQPIYKRERDRERETERDTCVCVLVFRSRSSARRLSWPISTCGGHQSAHSHVTSLSCFMSLDSSTQYDDIHVDRYTEKCRLPSLSYISLPVSVLSSLPVSGMCSLWRNGMWIWCDCGHTHIYKSHRHHHQHHCITSTSKSWCVAQRSEPEPSLAYEHLQGRHAHTRLVRTRTRHWIIIFQYHARAIDQSYVSIPYSSITLAVQYMWALCYAVLCCAGGLQRM